MKININETVRVELTDYGKKMYLKFFMDLYHNNEEHIEWHRELMEKQYLEIELCNIMNILGKHLYMGNINVFKDNNIDFIGILDKSADKEVCK